jgi:hypothetical protein
LPGSSEKLKKNDGNAKQADFSMLIRALASIFSFSYFWLFCFLFLLPGVELYVLPVFGPFSYFGFCFLASLCFTLLAKSASQTMFSIDSASAQSTKQSLLFRFSRTKWGIAFSFLFAFQNVRFLFENTTLGPPKTTLAFFA